MTIDEAIRYYENKNVVLTEEEALANTIAIETMRKYKKIKQITDDWENSGEEDDPINIIDNIEEVLEDGKTD